MLKSYQHEIVYHEQNVKISSTRTDGFVVCDSICICGFYTTHMVESPDY